MGARRSGGRDSVRIGKDHGVSVIASIATDRRPISRGTLLATASFVLFVSCSDQALAACPGANRTIWSSIVGPVLRAARFIAVASEEAAAGSPDADDLVAGPCPAPTATIHTVRDVSSGDAKLGVSSAAAGDAPALSDRPRFVFAGTIGTLISNSDGGVGGDHAAASSAGPAPVTSRFVYAGTTGTLTSNSDGDVSGDIAVASSSGIAGGGAGVANPARFVYTGAAGALTSNRGVETTDGHAGSRSSGAAVVGDSNRPRFVFADTNAPPTDKSGDAIRDSAGHSVSGPAAAPREEATSSGAIATATNSDGVIGGRGGSENAGGDAAVSNRGTTINGSGISDGAASLSATNGASGDADTSRVRNDHHVYR